MVAGIKKNGCGDREEWLRGSRLTSSAVEQGGTETSTTGTAVYVEEVDVTHAHDVTLSTLGLGPGDEVESETRAYDAGSIGVANGGHGGLRIDRGEERGGHCGEDEGGDVIGDDLFHEGLGEIISGGCKASTLKGDGLREERVSMRDGS